MDLRRHLDFLEILPCGPDKHKVSDELLQVPQKEERQQLSCANYV